MKLQTKIASPLAALGLASVLATTSFGGMPTAKAPDEHATEEADITRLTTSLMENSQFAHHPFDDKMAGILLDRYIDSLDGRRSLFLQSDVDEFAKYRATLAQATRTA